jgi:CRISPR-associated endoribonuclease Cas6
MQYHYHMQGFIYNLLRGSKFHYIHNKKGYKFFCFSNIFPVTRNLEKNDMRTMIISSPSTEFITYVYEILQQQSWNAAAEIKIVNMRFRIDSVDKLIVTLPDDSPFTLITGTPIIVRIPREKYKEYSIEPSNKYDYIYWRSEHPIDLFISQIENNLLKKYMEYYGPEDNGANIQNIREITSTVQPSSFSFFQKIKFKKQVSTRLLMKDFEQIVIGTVWEFGFNVDVNKTLIQFVLDTGLGERNSLGFGFINLNHAR